MNSSLTSDNTISVELLFFHAEVVASVSHKLIVFDERTRIKEQLYSLASCKSVLLVMLVNSGLSAT